MISYKVTNSTLFLGSFVPTTSTLTSEQTRDKCLLKLSTSKGVKKSFSYCLLHTAWTFNFVINIMLSSLFLSIKWSTNPAQIGKWIIYRQEFHLKRIKFIANMTVQAVCTTRTEGLRYTQKKVLLSLQ